MRKLVGITALFAGLALLFSAGAMPAYADPGDPPGANGTVKIHEYPTHKNDSENANDPKVCRFEVHGFNFDSGQTGRWWIQEHTWGNGDSSKAVLSGTYKADANGDWTDRASTLPDGHYKLFVELTHTAGNSGNTVVTYKMKVFKVECGEEKVTPTPTPTPVNLGGGSTPTPIVGGFESSPTTTPVTTIETETVGNVTIRTETTAFVENGERIVIIQVFHNDMRVSTNERRTAVAGSESTPGSTVAGSESPGQSVLAGLGSLPATSTGAAGLGLIGLAITGLGLALLRRQPK